jgi:hypothetical protein
MPLWGLWRFYFIRAELHAAREPAEQCLGLARKVQDAAFLLEAQFALGGTLLFLGEDTPARTFLELSIALYDSQQHRSLALLYGQDPGVSALSYAA